MQDFRRLVHEGLGFEAVLVGGAVDRVRRECERGAHEPDQRAAALGFFPQPPECLTSERQRRGRVLETQKRACGEYKWIKERVRRLVTTWLDLELKPRFFFYIARNIFIEILILQVKYCFLEMTHV